MGAINSTQIAAAGLLGFSLLVAHTVADHWAQTGWEAKNKGRRDAQGRAACLSHVATYTLTALLFLGSLVLLGVHLSWFGVLAGQVISAVSHYIADRRYPLENLAKWLGKGDFYKLGQPRDIMALTDNEASDTISVYDRIDREPVTWDNPALGTGAYVLDQSFHWFFIFITTIVTSVLS